MSRLIFSPSELNLVLEPGQVLDGHISVSCSEAFEGAAIASGIGMVCREARFDARSGMIPWRFQTAGFAEGDTADGFFRIISDHGEYKVPYHVVIGAAGSGMEERILDLPAFAALAEEDWDAALRLFYSRRFEEIPLSDHEAALYVCLSAEKDSSYNMEQFLTAACGKIPVQVRPSLDRIETELNGKSAGGRSQRIRLVLSRWGYGRTRIEVQAEPEFLECRKTLLQEEDFTEDKAEVFFTIVESCLHAGRNLGMIRIRCGRALQEIPVCVIRSRQDPARAMASRALLHTRMQLIRILEAYGAGTMTAAGLETAVRPCIDKLEIYDRKQTDARLWRIWLNQETGRPREAEKELTALRTLLSGRPGPIDPDKTFVQYRGEDDLRYQARLYLMARQQKQDRGLVPRTTRILRERYRRDQTCWPAGYLYMKLEPEYAPGTKARWDFLRRQFERGTKSPLLYMEAWNMVSADPALLDEGPAGRTGRRTKDTWKIQLFAYGVRRGRISIETGEKLLSFADTVRDTDRVLIRTLQAASRLESLSSLEEPLLKKALQMMIEAGDSAEKDFSWYRRGLERGIRIPLLIPMALQSMPLSGADLPGSMIGEMVEAGDLSYAQRARLYLYIYENRDKDPDSFSENKRLIRAFIRQQLAAGRMTKVLSGLYRAALTDPLLQPEETEGLPEAAFTCLVEADVPEADRILVRYDQFRGTRTLAAGPGGCHVPVYGRGLCLLAADHRGNRTVLDPDSLGVSLTAAGFPDAARSLKGTDPVYEAMRASLSLEKPLVTDKTIQTALDLLKDQNLLPVPRERLFTAILSYYKKEGDSGRILRLLDSLDKAGQDVIWNGRNRDQVLICAAAADHPALPRLLKGAGRNRVSEEAFREVLSSAVRQTGSRHDPVLGELCYDALTEGYRDAGVFAYAGRSFVGLSAELDALRLMWEEEGGETDSLLGREADQLAFSREAIPGMEAMLLALGERSGPDPSLLKALAGVCCRDLLARGKAADPTLLPLLERCGKEEGDDADRDYCRVLYLQAHALGAGGSRETAGEFLRGLLDKDIRMPFFRDLADLDCRVESWRHETVFLYMTGREDDGRDLTLLAETCREDTVPGPADLAPRPFREILPGCRMASFLLFSGEAVHYVITEDPAEGPVRSRGKILPDAGKDGLRDRYRLVERIQTALSAGRRKEAVELIKEYYITDRIVRRVFEEQT